MVAVCLFERVKSGCAFLLHTVNMEESVENAEDLFARAVKRSKKFEYHAQFTLQDKRPLNLDDGMQLFNLLDTDKSGSLSFKEVRRGCVKHRSKEVEALLMRHKSTPLGLLLEKESAQNLFDHVNVDDDKEISLAEWKFFLAMLIERDLDYIREKGLSNYTAYWAREDPEKLEVSDEFSWREWFADFQFYECNNNGLLGIFFADHNNTLKTLERLNIEFCCESWVLCFTALLENHQVYGENYHFLALFCFVTLPSVFIRNVLLYCFRCSCLIRRHNMSTYRGVFFPVLEFFGHVVGLVTFLAAIVLLIAGIILAAREGRNFVSSFLFSWGMSYVYGFLSDLLLPFNPSVSLRILSEKPMCCCMRLMGFAKWQKQRIQVLAALTDREDACSSLVVDNNL